MPTLPKLFSGPLPPHPPHLDFLGLEVSHTPSGAQGLGGRVRRRSWLSPPVPVLSSRGTLTVHRTAPNDRGPLGPGCPWCQAGDPCPPQERDKWAPPGGFTNFISRLSTFVLFPAGNVPVTHVRRGTGQRAAKPHRPQVPPAQPPQTCQSRASLWPWSTPVTPPPRTGRPSRTPFGSETLQPEWLR